MTNAASWLLALVLVVALVTHVALLGAVARKTFWRLPLAALVPPLAPYWGWQLGLRKPVIVWWVSVLAYALGVVVLARY